MVAQDAAGASDDVTGARAGRAGRGSDDAVEVVDVVVVGGGAAGLSGATALARFRRSVVVVDAGAPRNAPAAGVHNYLSRDGVSPGELVAIGRREVTGYGGRVVDGAAVAARRTSGGFEVDLADGVRLRARRLLVATGLVDELPDVPGLAERWGTDVLHCPYCHGWEVRDRVVGVLGTGPTAVHTAQLWRQLSDEVTLFLHSGPEPTEEQWEQLSARGIGVVDGTVTGLVVEDDALAGVRLADGTVVHVQALAVGSGLRARADVLAGLGLAATGSSLGPVPVGTRVESGAGGATSVPGVHLAGNITDPLAQVAGAVAAGLAAGAAINADLVAEDVERAVQAHRRTPLPRRGADDGPFSAAMEAEVARRVQGDRVHGL